MCVWQEFSGNKTNDSNDKSRLGLSFTTSSLRQTNLFLLPLNTSSGAAQYSWAILRWRIAITCEDDDGTFHDFNFPTRKVSALLLVFVFSRCGYNHHHHHHHRKNNNKTATAIRHSRKREKLNLGSFNVWNHSTEWPLL